MLIFHYIRDSRRVIIHISRYSYFVDIRSWGVIQILYSSSDCAVNDHEKHFTALPVPVPQSAGIEAMPDFLKLYVAIAVEGLFTFAW